MFLGKNSMHDWCRIYFLGVSVAFLAFVSANMRATAGDPGGLAIDCDAMIDIHVPQNPQHADFVMRVQFSQRLVCLVRSESVYRASYRVWDCIKNIAAKRLKALPDSTGQRD
jgi:hypothetical protein